MSPERVLAASAGLIALAAALRSGRRSLSDWGTPADVMTVYLTLWGGILVLFSIPVLEYATTPVLAWLAIYGAIMSGAVACALVRRHAGRGVVAPPSERAAALRAGIDARRLRLLWAFSAIAGLAGMASFVYAVSRVLPWSAIVSDPEAVRDAKTNSEIFQREYGLLKLLTYFNQVAFILWTMGLRLGSFTGRWSLVRWVGAGSALPFLFTADRGLLVATVVWALVLHLMWPQRQSARRVLTGLALSIICLGVVVTAVGNRYGGSLEGHPEIAQYVTTRHADPVAIPYMYLTANIPTFGRLTEDHLAPLNLGAMTTLPFAKTAESMGVVEAAPIGTGVFYPIPFESFSNYTWLGTFWLDFRIPGAILMPALVLGLTAFFQIRALRRPSIGRLWITSLLLFVIVFSPFANQLSATLTWQFLLLTPAVTLALQRGAANSLIRRVRSAAPRSAVAIGGAALVSLAVVLVTINALRVRSEARIDPQRELSMAIAKARSVFPEFGKYPRSPALTTRLQVSRPETEFRALPSALTPLPGPGIVGVYSEPTQVFMRVMARDGKIYEVHRTEEWGGVTFGPGTRDG